MVADNYDRCMVPFRHLSSYGCPAAGIATYPYAGAAGATAATAACQAGTLALGHLVCRPRP